MKPPIFFIETENVNATHLEMIEKTKWQVPSDFTPSSVRNYKLAYTSCIAFLISKSHNKETQAGYLSEMERFLQWCLRIKKVQPAKLTTSNLISYLEFRENPCANWVSSKRQRKTLLVGGKKKINSLWRPFVASRDDKISVGTMTRTHSIISSYYRFLCQIDIIRYNPFLKVSRNLFASKLQQKKHLNVLGKKDINLVESTLNRLIKEDDKYTRENFIVVSMLYMHLRVSDLATYNDEPPRMSDFTCSFDGKWYFRAYGWKASRSIERANKKVMNALVMYRRYLSLADYPLITDESPLILARHGKTPITTTRTIYQLVKNVLELSINEAKESSWCKEDLAALKQATARWIKNTGEQEKNKIG